MAISGWVTFWVRISFRSIDFWLSYGHWTCIFCSNLKLSGLFLTSFDILTWYLVSGYIGMSYSVRSNFVPVEWLLADLWPLNLYFCSNVKLSGLFLDVLWYIDLIFGIWLYLDEIQFKLEFCSGRMIFSWVMALELVFFVQIWSCPDFSLYINGRQRKVRTTSNLNKKYKFKGHNPAKNHSTGTKFALKLYLI